MIQQGHLNDAILRSASQLSETIKKSIKFDMLKNRKENAYHIMKTIAEQEGIERVRIYNSDGKIIFSTDKKEFGKMVNKKAEACYGCHSEKKPIEKLDMVERSRIFGGPQPYRILGSINPLYNEPDCSSAQCHVHPESQKVLGVIDINMSLAEMDKDLALARSQILFSNMLSIVIISLIITIIFLKLIGKPVKELIRGARSVAIGNLDYTIPVGSKDEMGYLAKSFNSMTRNLQKANSEIREWIRTLERKVEERTVELHTAESQLLHSEKLAAIGKIAATVAHEINNPLSGVVTYIKLIQRKMKQTDLKGENLENIRSYLETMNSEIDRIRSIVQDLLDFTRQKKPERRSTDINRVIDESLRLIADELQINNITVDKDLETLPTLMVDPSQIQQVCVDLMVNACEAMSGGGRLMIRSHHDETGKIVVVEVADTGMGIPEENLSKIYDPFFSTKTKGTGLGLSVVYGIVTRHGGSVEAESEMGKGTRIRVFLPTELKGQAQ